MDPFFVSIVGHAVVEDILPSVDVAPVIPKSRNFGFSSFFGDCCAMSFSFLALSQAELDTSCEGRSSFFGSCSFGFHMTAL